MRPISLYLKNFGSYVEETIDFGQLQRNLFIVSGSTGSGKSFIFDAMTFAIYGSSCGDREKSRLRRDNCTEDDSTMVIFTFSLGSIIYRVSRTLKVAPSEKGTSNAVTKKKVEVLDSQTKEFRKINLDPEKDLIKLSLQEFKQVILLPQNKFSDFIRQSDEDKKKTLQKIFHTDIADTVLDKISAEYKKVKDENAPVEAQINSILDGRTREDIELSLEKYRNQIDECTSQINVQNSEVEKQNLLISQLQVERENAKRKQSLEQEKRALEQDSKKISELKEKLETGKRVLPVFDAICERKNAQSEHEAIILQGKEISENLLESKEKLESCSREKKLIPELESSIKELSFVLKQKNDLLSKIGERDEKKSMVEKAALNLEEKRNQLAKEEKVLSAIMAKCRDNKTPEEILGELQEKRMLLITRKNSLDIELQRSIEIEKLTLQVKELEKRLLAENSQYTELEKQIDAEKENIEKERVSREIYDTSLKLIELAKKLPEGRACPLCGSTCHPHLIESCDYVPQIDLDKAEKNLEKLSDSLAESKSRIVKIKTMVDEKKKMIESTGKAAPLMQLQEDINGLDENISRLNSEEAVFVELKKEYKNVRDSIGDLKITVEKLDGSYNAALSSYNEFIRNFNEKSEVSCEELESELKEIKLKHDQDEARKNSILNDFSTAEKKVSVLETKNEDCRKNIDASSEKLSKLISVENDLLRNIKDIAASPSDVERLHLSQDEMDDFENKIAEYEKKLLFIDGQLKSFSETRDLETIEKEFCENEKIAHEKKAVLLESNARLTEAQTQLMILSDGLEKLNSLMTQRKKSLKEMESYEFLLDYMRPKSGVTFDLWYLAAFFSEVVTKAGKRFYDFSDGQYTFNINSSVYNAKGQKGLSLSILNMEKGTELPVSSLSGGEIFEASLSLALAITDSIYDKSGGIDLDSIFIDEGFGTLDDRTRNVVIPILRRLSSSKMVGVISHVKELQQEIMTQIQVSKSEDFGSKVRVVN